MGLPAPVDPSGGCGDTLGEGETCPSVPGGFSEGLTSLLSVHMHERTIAAIDMLATVDSSGDDVFRMSMEAFMREGWRKMIVGSTIGWKSPTEVSRSVRKESAR
jgi:hypothetical protein